MWIAVSRMSVSLFLSLKNVYAGKSIFKCTSREALEEAKNDALLSLSKKGYIFYMEICFHHVQSLDLGIFS